MTARLNPRRSRLAFDRRGPLARPRVELFVIGCSTGGPGVLHRIIPALPANFPAPIIVVQHMPAGFVKPLADHLNAVSALRVELATDRQPVRAGCVLFAPATHHVGVRYRRRHELEIVFDDSPPVHGCKPAIDPLARSMARLMGDRSGLVILTGMGHDGLDGARVVRKVGGLVAAQDEDSSRVFGMPRAVAEQGLAHMILCPTAIAPFMSSAVAP